MSEPLVQSVDDAAESEQPTHRIPLILAGFFVATGCPIAAPAVGGKIDHRLTQNNPRPAAMLLQPANVAVM
ncbi:hypothetical protein [Ancylobacter dichloromethanicus]|uniref:Uncharacterized protein n=1 Tax=Ancylobacter dichloromethanicus TaxID=518825 RepID=A0A9W6N066_9HYPH|nr:hypothetical protein GCM10017643_28180 [Ancylobacter dichloromethanicus]